MKRYFLLFSGLLSLLSAIAQQVEWETHFELSGKLETPSYQATIDYCRQLDRGSDLISYTTFGKTPQGRDLALLILDREGLTDPAAIHASGRVVLMIQACIHAGESDGKDAGLMLFRDLAIRDNKRELLEKVSVIFIPVFNADGHERSGPYSRINQNGPKEMGWRTNSVNLNLNRDYLKADSREMQAWLQLFNRWMPDFFVDCHTTDGADYQYVLTYLMEIYGTMDDGLTGWCKDIFISAMEKDMHEAGYPVFPYVGFRSWHDPRSGLITEPAPPMLSQGYTSLRNRPGLLIETHMLKPYGPRVESTYQCLLSTLEILNREGEKLKSLVRSADSFLSTKQFRDTSFPLRFETLRNDSTMVDFLGFEYDVVKSDLSGGNWFRYSKIPATMKLPYFNKTRPSVTANLPVAYIVPAEWIAATDRLTLHGIQTTTLKKETTLKIATCHFKNPKWQPNPVEGHHPMTNIEYDDLEETRVFPAGSMLVEVMQPAGRIIPHLLEPKGNGSLVYWGFFDAIFEQKEYVESYVMEAMARKMIAEDPELGREFEQKKASDSLFAQNPQMILNWFYQKTPYADNRRYIYPVGKIYDPAVVERLKR